MKNLPACAGGDRLPAQSPARDSRRRMARANRAGPRLRRLAPDLEQGGGLHVRQGVTGCRPLNPPAVRLNRTAPSDCTTPCTPASRGCLPRWGPASTTAPNATCPRSSSGRSGSWWKHVTSGCEKCRRGIRRAWSRRRDPPTRSCWACRRSTTATQAVLEASLPAHRAFRDTDLELLTAAAHLGGLVLEASRAHVGASRARVSTIGWCR